MNYRHRVELQRRTQGSADAHGQPVFTYESWRHPWANIEPISGREYYDALAAKSQATHRIRLRWTPGVTADMRVWHQGRTFEIESIINVEERNAELELMCKEASV